LTSGLCLSAANPSASGRRPARPACCPRWAAPWTAQTEVRRGDVDGPVSSIAGPTRPLVVFGWGFASLTLTFVHVFGGGEELGDVLVGYAVPMLIATAVLGVGAWLHRSDVPREEFWRVGLWCSAGILGMVGFEISRVLYQTSEGAGVVEPFCALFHAGTAGALGGVLLGMYEVRGRDRERALRAEREWADRLSQGLVVLQRVLRNDIRTAVNVIRGNAELLREDEGEDDANIERIIHRATVLDEMATKARHIEPIVERDAQGSRPLDLMAPLRSQVETLRSEYPAASIAIDGPDGVTVRALPEIRFALREVVENAIVHGGPDQAAVHVEIDRAPGDGSTGLVEDRDDGPGIPREEVAVLTGGSETPLLHSSGIGLWAVE